MYLLFDKNGNHIGSCDFEPDLKDLATRGEVAVEFAGDLNGTAILVDSQIQVVPYQPTGFHTFKNGQWVLSAEGQEALFEQNKTALLTKLANKADELKNSLLVGYPQTEIESFYRQEKEALGWKADKTSSTPMLTQIAKLRGVPFEILVEKVLEKSAQFAVAIGVIIGKRQAFEDKLLAIKAPEELSVLEQEVEQWQL